MTTMMRTWIPMMTMMVRVGVRGEAFYQVILTLITRAIRVIQVAVASQVAAAKTRAVVKILVVVAKIRAAVVKIQVAAVKSRAVAKPRLYQPNPAGSRHPTIQVDQQTRGIKCSGVAQA